MGGDWQLNEREKQRQVEERSDLCGSDRRRNVEGRAEEAV
jgi:hypothetical protein